MVPTVQALIKLSINMCVWKDANCFFMQQHLELFCFHSR